MGIGRWFTALTLFVIVDLLQKINMGLLNGGDRMARLILLYLIVADTYQYFVLSKHKNEAGRTKKIQNLFTNLAALSIMIQLCIAYFTSAVAKLNDPLWLNGEAIY